MALPKTTALIADQQYFVYQQLANYGQNEIFNQSDYSSIKSEYTPAKPELVEVEVDEVSMDPEDEFYTLEEQEQMEDKSMTYMAARFKHIKFTMNPQ